MSNRDKYFTTEELAAESQKLMQQGRPLWAIAENPKCPPAVAKNMLRLKELSNQRGKGAGHGQK
ncbi:MAG: hypothetical protein A2W90_14580 [Bacteroidetes bacterium GWF2_42_66]|nr:MAG: hypothetical protein A2W92_15975 [Bacteroidetes bacterium GWA2_42_15]OFX99079.1 MAG: hypothetical protein A2W89_06680 [Bacteroidetes bacterium GWE2_42_39]OFY46752.1 MAG: hypothetical protein A2W90_14580 [Bacteroidetes bacterium GWF2_42_66]HAZ00699.1 hypothetical protein [Marinilabiliales bacterium]HBL73841.1 hypothetical protein [Prolixibacteraceae bacterium]